MNKKIKYCIINLIAMFSLLFSGCYSVPQQLQQVKYNDPVFDKSISVLPLHEMRNQYSSSASKDVLGFLPLVLYFTREHETPEFDSDLSRFNSMYANNYNYLYREAVGRINDDIFSALKHSDLFKNTYQSYSADESSANYLLEGELLSTRAYETMFIYGITYIGAFPLWMLGLPAIQRSYCLNINLRVVDSTTDKVLWEKKFNKELSYTLSMYSPKSNQLGLNSENLKLWHDYFVKEIMNEAIPEIKASIEK